MRLVGAKGSDVAASWWSSDRAASHWGNFGVASLLDPGDAQARAPKPQRRIMLLWDFTGARTKGIEWHRSRNVMLLSFYSGTAAIVDAMTGVVLTAWSALDDVPCRSSAFHPTDDVVATGGDDCMVRLWDTSTDAPQLLQTIALQRDYIRSVRFDHNCAPKDGRLLLASDDQTARIVNAEDTKEIKGTVMTSHYCMCAEYNRDSTYVAVASLDTTVYICHGDHMKVLQKLTIHQRGVNWISWDRHSNTLCVSYVQDGNGQWTFFNSYEGHDGNVSSLFVDTSQNMIVSGSEDCSLILWNFEDSIQEHRLVVPYRFWVVSQSYMDPEVFAGGHDAGFGVYRVVWETPEEARAREADARWNAPSDDMWKGSMVWRMLHGDIGGVEVLPQAQVGAHRRAVESGTADFATATRWGLDRQARGEYADAMAAFGMSTALKPTSSRAFFRMAMTMALLHQNEAAVCAAQEAIRLRSVNLSAHFLLGALFARMLNWSAAAASFRNIVTCVALLGKEGRRVPDNVSLSTLHVQALLGEAQALLMDGRVLAARSVLHHMRSPELQSSGRLARIHSVIEAQASFTGRAPSKVQCSHLLARFGAVPTPYREPIEAYTVAMVRACTSTKAVARKVLCLISILRQALLLGPEPGMQAQCHVVLSALYGCTAVNLLLQSVKHAQHALRLQHPSAPQLMAQVWSRMQATCPDLAYDVWVPRFHPKKALYWPPCKRSMALEFIIMSLRSDCLLSTLPRNLLYMLIDYMLRDWRPGSSAADALPDGSASPKASLQRLGDFFKKKRKRVVVKPQRATLFDIEFSFCVTQ